MNTKIRKHVGIRKGEVINESTMRFYEHKKRMDEKKLRLV